MNMTKAVRSSRILKDANGDISDHLRNHIHLTNCIHLKNHLHKQSPILADRSLMRDLIALQRSRSLRDPSASPPSWHSTSIVDLLPKKGDNYVNIEEGRRSIGAEHYREGRRLSGSSPPLVNLGLSKVVPHEGTAGNDDAVAHSDRSSKSGIRDSRRFKREEPGRMSNAAADVFSVDAETLQNQENDDFVREAVSGSSELKGVRNKKKGKCSDERIKTLSEQLSSLPVDSDVASSNIHHARHSRHENIGEGFSRGYSGATRVKKRRVRGNRRTRAVQSVRDAVVQSEMSVASNSLGKASTRPRHYKMEEEDEEEGDIRDQNVARAPRNGCGIPWNWSRIHDRGKTFLDKAGRSFSCGLSDPRSRKGCSGSHGRDMPEMPVVSEYSSRSTKSDAEALPLLIEASGSPESDNAGWVHDYSGELGIYADHLLKTDIDSDLASEARSGDRLNLGRNHNGRRHQNLTQKYMPRTFRDLVGQNLVVQALTNAVIKRKVGLLYIFYGPHGTGKTSCARIFARALNCQSLEHPKPCGYCDSCIANNLGKSRNIKEVGPVSNFDFESIMDLLENMITSQVLSQYRVFIFDDCDTMSADCWSAILKVIDRAPRRVVFVLVCSSLDVLPHIIISRCQKFFFPKLKDADIIYALQWIAAKEDIEIEKDALKLIASRSDGSLRDAEMTVEQLSLLGQKITVPLVQELVGLISDEKLVDLLDLALSADTVNTVKNLRVIMETGVEPLALMSQLATIITDILASTYDFAKERHRRKFFRHQPLSKEDMEKLRQALKTLSEAEKQLRMSNDKLTWLTAALLQLAPDQQYMLPNSSTDTSFNHSPLAVNNMSERAMASKSFERSEHNGTGRALSTQVRFENLPAGLSGDARNNFAVNGMDRQRNSVAGMTTQLTSAQTFDTTGIRGKRVLTKNGKGYEDIWLDVLGRIHGNAVREFLYQNGKLLSISFGTAPTVQLMFRSQISKLKAEKLSAQILQAFESVLGSPVTIEIRCESHKETDAAGLRLPIVLPASKNNSSHTAANPNANIRSRAPIARESLNIGNSEIVEIPASPMELKGRTGLQHTGGEVAATGRDQTMSCVSERRRIGEPSQSRSIVKSKVSLAHVIQQAEAQQTGWSKRKAVSIAEKLEQENLRLEPRSRSLLCWKASRVTRRKLCRLKIRSRRPHSLLKLVSCGKCLSSKSPR